MAIQGHLDNLRTTLLKNFSTVPLLGEKEDVESFNMTLFSQNCCTDYIFVIILNIAFTFKGLSKNVLTGAIN